VGLRGEPAVLDLHYLIAVISIERPAMAAERREG